MTPGLQEKWLYHSTTAVSMKCTEELTCVECQTLVSQCMEISYSLLHEMSEIRVEIYLI